MMPHYNLHQHSTFSDGKETPEKYVEQAKKLGFTAIGFTEHSPLPFQTPFSLKMENIASYVRLLEELQKKYEKSLSIYRALEMDFIPGLSDDFDFWRKAVKADYLIGSVHLVKPDRDNDLWFIDGPDQTIYDKGIDLFFEGDIKKAVARFFAQTMEMIETQNFEIIGHFDKIKMHNRNRFFTEDEKWYQKLIDEVIDLIQQKDIIVEINTRGLYKKRSTTLFPDGITLQKIKDRNIPILISSDAHQPVELDGLFDLATKRLLEMGFKEVMYFDQRIWKTIPLN